MSLLPFFAWCDRTAIGAWIRDGTWTFPIIETVHILALTVLFGTVLVIDLRLMGAGLKRQNLSVIRGMLAPWMIGSLVVILSTGVMLFLSEALKCYGNDGFRFKMVALALALGFHFTVFRRASLSDERRPVVALISLALWLAVGAGGRAIGFV